MFFIYTNALNNYRIESVIFLIWILSNNQQMLFNSINYVTLKKSSLVFIKSSEIMQFSFD